MLAAVIFFATNENGCESRTTKLPYADKSFAYKDKTTDKEEFNCSQVENLNPNEIIDRYLKFDLKDEVIHLENIHTVLNGEKVRFQWSLESGPNGRSFETIKFFRLDEEELPIRSGLPERFKNLKWVDIKGRITIDYHSIRGDWLLNDQEVPFEKVDGKFTAYEVKLPNLSLICREGRCKCF